MIFKFFMFKTRLPLMNYHTPPNIEVYFIFAEDSVYYNWGLRCAHY